MFPVVSLSKEETQRIKQPKWQDRFNVKSTIPEYSPLKDKHTMSYRKLLQTHGSKEKGEPLTQRENQGQKTWFEKKVQLFQSLKTHHPVYLSHLQEFEDFLTATKVPNFYLYYSMIPLMSEIDVNGFILKTKKQIKEQTSPYHRIFAAIKAREKCLLEMKEILSKLPRDFINLTEKAQSVKDTIRNYRQLTANVIDEIRRWRESLKLKQQRAVFYEDNKENYLIKMLNDNQFVFNSILGEFINFGQKNDPFIIVPLKKSLEKEASQFISLIETEKNLAYYQKYMQYLASEKAYVMSLIPQTVQKRQMKYPEIQKIYTKSKSTAKLQKRITPLEDFQEPINDLDNKQKQKQRQQRLRKNQDRINAIKSVYESYSAKMKLKQIKKQAKKAQTDVQEKTKKQHNYHSISKNKKIKQKGDQQFDKMVRNKLENQRNKRYSLNQEKPSQNNISVKSLPKPVIKSQDKMIQNLKQIQQNLKSKLSFISEQTRKEQQSSNLQKEKQIRSISSTLNGTLNKLSSQAMISELKSEIIKNLQIQSQEREIVRQKRRQQEQRAIDEIKLKMKKQMEDKVQLRKKQKMLQREDLERKLKEQEQRLNKQRELEIQLQLKLAKQKQLRQLQKVKRQSLEKQMRYKEELQKQQSLRRQRQQTIQKQKIQKQKLIEELKKNQLKQQLEKEIKEQLEKQFKSQMNINYFQNENNQQNNISQDTHYLAKQIQNMQKHSNQQIIHIQKENQLRSRTLKLKQQEEELKTKELQQLMKTILNQEKQHLQKQTLKKRLQLQEDIKNQTKSKLLQQLQLQNKKMLQNEHQQTQKQLQEQLYRQQIKQKLEKQMRIEAIQKTQKQIQQREQRRYQLNQKLTQQNNKLTQTLIINNSDINKSKIQSEVKNQLISKLIYDKQAEKQKAKNDLRLQFQKQLFGSPLKQFSNQTTGSFVTKNIQKLKGDEFLDRRMEQLIGEGLVRPTNQKPQDLKNSRDQSLFNTNLSNTEYPQKIQRNQSLLSSITNEQRQMYDKKRIKLVDMIAQPSYKLPSKISQQQQGFELIKVQKVNKSEDNDLNQVKIIRKSPLKKNQLQQRQYSKKKNPTKTIHEEPDSQDQQYSPKKEKTKIKNSPSKKPTIKKYQSQEEDSQENFKFSQNKNKLNKKKRRDSDEPESSESEEIKYRQQSRRSSLRKQQSMRSRGEQMKRNDTNLGMQSNKKSYNEGDRIHESGLRRSNASGDSIQYQSPLKVYYDSQIPSNTKQTNPLQTSFTPQRSLKPIAESRYTIKLQAIQQHQLDEYLGGHFEQLPEIQKQIQLIDRESLYRKLINELTFCLLLGYQKDVLVGMAMCVHDRNKTDIRKFTLVHFSTYHNEDLKQFLLSCVNFIFRKDPTDQIQFNLKFDESIPQQLSYSQQFNKWFDNYGNVYQKKISQNIYERKYVTKRQFNQKCEVILQGVNKNSFRNLFTVYSGVLMCDSDMIQLKQELKDAISPQSQVSYAVAMAELFRTYLTPDEAQILKSKVKQFAKLKQLLILVVMLQKKKVKLQQMKLSEYKSLIELNMRLMSQGKQVIRYCKDPGIEHNRVFYAELSQAFNLPFNFQTTSLPIESNSQIHHISYFRLSPLPPNKLHIIKSSLYNSEMHILPTQSSKYKIFVLNGQQYCEIRQKMQLDVFMYVRLFLKNVKSHNVAEWKYVWMPQISDSANYSVREFKSFLNKDIYCHDNVNISYKQFLPNALIIQPEHRDLVITPPFIVGVMSMALEQVTEGSPLYARVVEVAALKAIQVEETNNQN